MLTEVSSPVDVGEIPPKQLLARNAIDPTPDQIAPSEDAAHSPAEGSHSTQEHRSDPEFEDDVMDISRSEVDEGETSTYSPKLPNAELHHTTDLLNDEESYEPPSAVNILEQVETKPAWELPVPDIVTKATNDDTNRSNAGRPPQLGLIQGAQGEVPADNSSPSMSDASDPDDYEPPEPAVPVLEPALRPATMSPVSTSFNGFPNDIVKGTNKSMHSVPPLGLDRTKSSAEKSAQDSPEVNRLH